jgi:hypothetical protein
MDLTKVTTKDAVATYQATNAIFIGIIKEIRELSKKKPDAVMSAGKVKIINRILEDLKSILAVEPEGKFLDLLDDKELPQTSDAVLVMVQYETVLKVFKSRYHQSYRLHYGDSLKSAWITPEFINEYEGSEEGDD